MSLKSILEAVTVTAELTGTELSSTAKAAMADELSVYPVDAVLGALRRCRREIKGRLTFADIVTRLDDGRPGAEEAWALYPKDEFGSAAVTSEMHLAMASAWPLIQEGDKIAGRMAFKESYERITAQNRAAGVPVKWEVSLGHDVSEREAALVDAVQRNRIGVDRAVALLPMDAHERFLLSAGVTNHPMLAPPTQDQERNKARLREIISTLSDDVKPKAD